MVEVFKLSNNNDMGITQPVISSELTNIHNDFDKLFGRIQNIERVQKKQCWQHAFGCGKYRKG